MRTTHKREMYIPENAEQIEAPGTDAAVYFYERNGAPCAVAFHGRAQKPAYHHRYHDAEQRQRRLEYFLKERKEQHEYKEKKKAERLAGHTLATGDLLACSWGYDQTQVEFFQVVEIVGKNTVKIRPIAGEVIADDGLGCAREKPRPGQFIGQAETKRASAINSIKIYSHAWARPTHPDISHHVTGYGGGH